MIDLTTPEQRSVASVPALSPTKGWILSGSHTEAETPQSEPKSSVTQHVRRNPRSARLVPLISALALAAVVVTASVAAMTLGPATDSAASRADSPTVTASPSGRLTDDRVSRSGIRELKVTPSPVATTSSAPPAPNPAPSTKKANPPSGGGAVTSSGTCGASYYTGGGHTANGEAFNTNDFTAASKTLPFNTRVRVTNVANGKATVVRINDRGPYVGGRCLDLTRAAFGAIAGLGSGVITVRYEVLS
jgi:rare lipoprotein A